MSKNWTGKLRKAQRESNARILASVGPYRDEPVTWQPRYQYDRQPWILTRMLDQDLTENQQRLYRFSGRECHPVFPDRGKNERRTES